MFKLIGSQVVEGVSLYAIQDTTDDSMDIVDDSQIIKFLKVGFVIDGITSLPDFSDFEYDDSNFVQQDEDEEETENYAFNDDDEDEEDDYSQEYNDEDEEDEDEDDSEYSADYSETEYEDASEENENAEDEDEDDDYVDYSSDYGDDDEDDYSVYERDETAVSKLYTFLTPEQIRLLKMYYLWYSQNIFNAARKDPTLNMQSASRRAQKKADLDQLRSEGGLWHYAGFIDTGYFKGGRCTLGHDLRYMHLAWDVTVSTIEESFWGESFDTDLETILDSNNVIVFGIKCITDFFEVDQDCMHNLLKAQRESLKEMEMLCNLYTNNKQNEVIESFALLHEIMTKAIKHDSKQKLINGKNAEVLVSEGLTQFYIKFRDSGMPLPKSLVQAIRDELVGWSSHKFTGVSNITVANLSKTFTSLFGNSSSVLFTLYGRDYYFSHSEYSAGKSNYHSALRCYLDGVFYINLTGYYHYDPYSSIYKDEGGASQKMKDWVRSMSYSLKNYFWADYKYSVPFILNLIKVCQLVSNIAEKFKDDKSSIGDIRFDGTFYKISTETYLSWDSLKRQFTNFDELNGTTLARAYNIASSKNPYGGRHFPEIETGITELEEMSASLETSINQFTSYMLDIQQESIDESNKVINKRLRDEEEAKKRREESLAEEIRFKNERIDAERRRDEENERRAEEAVMAIETGSNEHKAIDILDYCIEAIKDKDNISKIEAKNPFIMKILKSVSTSGKASDKQMFYVSQAYEALTGIKVETERAPKLLLSEHQDILSDITKIQNSVDDLKAIQGVADAEKTLLILSSILKYGSASDKQLKYLTTAKTDLGLE